MISNASMYPGVLAAVCAFLLLVAVVRHYAPKSPLPPESWLLLAGIGYGTLSPFSMVFPQVQLNPALVVNVLLPMLVFSEGRNLPVALLIRSGSAVGLLIVGGTALSIVFIGLPMAWLLGLPLSYGLLLGATVSATDPTPISHSLVRARAPTQLRTLLDGESIFNDALAIVLFSALSLVTVYGQDISYGELGITSLRSILLSIPIGLLLGWLAGSLVRYWQEQNRIPGLTLTLALPLAAYLISHQLLQASGIIAVLFAVLAFSHTRREQKMPDRELFNELWQFLGSLAASLLYFSLGAVIGGQAFTLGWMTILLIVLYLLSRSVLVYLSGPLLRTRSGPLPLPWRHVLMMGGLRGAVPAALALLIPMDYPHRESLQGAVFALVAYSVLVHPLLLNGLQHRFDLQRGRHVDPQESHSMEAMTPRLSGFIRRSSWSLAAWAGFIAGCVFLVFELSMVELATAGSLWGPVRMIAAIGLGPSVVPPPATFSGQVLLVALVVHFMLSLVYAWILAPLIEHIGFWLGLVVGLAFGLALYAVNFYVFALMFPWFSEARTLLTISAHWVFGLTLAGSYMGLRQRYKSLERLNAGSGPRRKQR